MRTKTKYLTRQTNQVPLWLRSASPAEIAQCPCRVSETELVLLTEAAMHPRGFDNVAELVHQIVLAAHGDDGRGAEQA
jgi:hypothetical protein